MSQPTPDAEARAWLIAELRDHAECFVREGKAFNAIHPRSGDGHLAAANLMSDAADLLAAEGWRDISVYPKDAEYRLLYSSAHGQVVGAHVTGDVWHLVGVGAITDASSRPTHWMPLPAPPGGTR